MNTSKTNKSLIEKQNNNLNYLELDLNKIIEFMYK
jgi:hypothetical protein